jgi:D-amino-acid oxidase
MPDIGGVDAEAGHRVGKPGSLLQDLERRTWPELERLARDVPAAAIHFQST